MVYRVMIENVLFLAAIAFDHHQEHPINCFVVHFRDCYSSPTNESVPFLSLCHTLLSLQQYFFLSFGVCPSFLWIMLIKHSYCLFTQKHLIALTVMYVQ